MLKHTTLLGNTSQSIHTFTLQATRPIRRREFMLAIKTKLLIEALDEDALAEVPILRLGRAR